MTFHIWNCGEAENRKRSTRH